MVLSLEVRRFVSGPTSLEHGVTSDCNEIKEIKHLEICFGGWFVVASWLKRFPRRSYQGNRVRAPGKEEICYSLTLVRI